MFTLSYRDEGGARRAREMPGGADVVIGRGPTCTLVLNHPTVSRQHARVSVRGGRCFLADLGSSYGTKVRGQRLSSTEVELQAGDTFTVGELPFSLERPVAVPAAPLPVVAVALSEDRQVVTPSETLYRRVDKLDGARGTATGGGATAADSSEASRLIRLLSEIGTTLVQVQPLPQVLERVIDLVFESVAADRAVLMLRDSASDALTPRVVRHADGREPGPAVLSRTVVNMVMRDRVAMLASDALNDARLDASGSIHHLNIRSFMCAPLWNRNEVIGVLYVDNPRSKKFSENDLTVFASLSNYAAVAIDHARLTERLLEETRRRERLQRYHSPGVVNRIITSEAAAATFETAVRDVTIMFADLVGFTTMAEQMDPDTVAATLNEFFGAMTEAIFDHQGTLDKFIGDAILAVFGAPFDDPDHAINAVRAAIDMKRTLGEMNARRPDRPLQVRIAIHSGRALAGDIGSPRRREFTVLGDTVNTASRLESSVARPGQIVMSKDTRDRLNGAIRATSLGPVQLRGRAAPIEVFSVDE